MVTKPAKSERRHWGSRLGFILAAAGSAVGLGNIWGFPYMTGKNGGGMFVLVYLACVALVGLPIMMAEIFIGREAQNSPVGAFRTLSQPRSPWIGVGWLGVITGVIILSFYSVIAGWSIHYVWLSIQTAGFSGMTPDEITPLFGELATNGWLSTMWHIVFMALTIAIVMGGIKGGIEICAKILMPALFLILIILLVWCMTTDGFIPGAKYILGLHDQDVLNRLGDDRPKFTASSWLAALGQAFFSLSIGMGALITYGSYLRREDDLVSTSIIVGLLDTTVALLAAFIIFPILFSAGQQPDQGPGLVFTSIPIAFSQMPGGMVLGPLFFVLLVFAAITSAISLLEVVTSYFIDEQKWPRWISTLVTGILITLLGIPSALAASSKLFGEQIENLTGTFLNKPRNWFDTFADLSFNILLPVGGLGIAMFVAWRVGAEARERGFKTGSMFGKMYWGWVQLLRWVVPIAVIVVLFNALGFFDWLNKLGVFEAIGIEW